MALEDISGYSLRRGLGSGSAGTVWLLRDRATGRHAVLKRIPKAAIAVPTDFLGDLELARTIDHPHIARLHEIRESDREWLLFSQYVAAGTLTSLLERRGVLSPGELVTLISPLAQALSLLHRTGLPHGQLTTDNIMFDADGRPVITDAGLRALAPPATPESDLQALSTIAQASGSTPQTFPPSLFATADHLTDHALHQSNPLPIDLGFTHDRHPTSPPTSATPTGPRTAPPTSPTNAQPPTTSRDSMPASSSSSPTTRSSLRGRSETSSAAADITPTLVATHRQQPQPPAQKGVRLPRPTHRKSAARKSAERKAARPTARQANQSRQPRRGVGQQPMNQAVRQFLRTKRAAYGILAACGAGALTTLAIGLATLGVLGHPTSSTAAADQSTHPTPQPTPTPTRTPPTTGTQPAPNAPATGPTVSTTPGAKATRGTPTGRPQSARLAEGKRWLQVLQVLDQRRSRAFAHLEVAELDAVYAAGSTPWAADRALISTYRRRHLRIEGLRMEIKNVTVETANARAVVLRIVDRLVSGAAVGNSGQRTAFPPGLPTTRRVTLTANGATWRISAITTA